MGDALRTLLARARRSRRGGYAAPVVGDVAEAQALAAAILAEIAQVAPGERLLRLAALSEIEAALQASTAQAQAEMAALARQLADARQGSAACRSYAAAGRPNAAQ